jgi:hypothetical protein
MTRPMAIMGRKVSYNFISIASKTSGSQSTKAATAMSTQESESMLSAKSKVLAVSQIYFAHDKNLCVHAENNKTP